MTTWTSPAISSMRLERPRSLAHALELLAADRALTPMAGCTDLYVGIHFGSLKPRRFLDLQPLASLRKIRKRADGTLVLGSLVTYTQCLESPLVGRELPMLVSAAKEIGGVQIRNRGTLGGNLGNASPAGDTLPVFLAARAAVVLASARGVRRIPISEFFLGYRQTARRHDELITEIEVPPVAGRQWFRKVGTRAANAISKVVAAGVRGDEITFALGAVAPVAMRAYAAERALASALPLSEAHRALRGEITPIDDLRSTAAYRARTACALLTQFWSETR